MWAAQLRWLRAAAIECGMDPDTALPEDILSQAHAEKGGLEAFDTYRSAALKVEAYARESD